MSKKPVIVVHGGAIFAHNDKDEYQSQYDKEYRKYLNLALDAGYKLLNEGKTAIDACIAAAKILENCAYFDAGKGAVIDSHGNYSLDASIMEGQSLRPGAVADCLIKNPCEAARLVMEKTKHVFIVGEGANELARTNGLDVVDYSYFNNHHFKKHSKHGTIGVLALDTKGNLAAVTSTGGLTNKLPHRIGDSPIIGAGVYANNETCAVSATGTGEFFIRTVAAFNVSARMKYGKENLHDASLKALDEITKMGAIGGMICLDREGNISLPYNGPGMFRGYINQQGERSVKIFED